MNNSFLTILFECRSVIHDIAARNTTRQAMSTVVCWADLILAKLGQAVVAAAGGLCGVVASDHHQPPTILMQKEDDALRAAVQLPGEYLARWLRCISSLLPRVLERRCGNLGLCAQFACSHSSCTKPPLWGLCDGSTTDEGYHVHKSVSSLYYCEIIDIQMTDSAVRLEVP